MTFIRYPHAYEIEIRLREHFKGNIRLGAAHFNEKLAVMFEVLIDNNSTKKYVNLERCLDEFGLSNGDMDLFYKTLFDQVEPIREEWNNRYSKLAEEKKQ